MRNVRVAAISMERQPTVEASLATAMIHMERAALFKPDIIVLPEACINPRDFPEPAPGNITNEFARKARDIGCYIIIPIEEITEDGTLYNTAVVLDPQGEICGKYRKMFPTDYEMAAGIMPGTEMPVFTTPKCRFGIATCFDLNFPELITGLARGGAEIVFFVSAYEGGRQLLQAALQNNVYIVSAHRGGIGYVVDKSGTLLQKGSRTQPVVVRNLNLDRQILHIDYNWRRLKEISTKYGAAIHIDFYQAEGIMALESLTDAVTVDDLIKEYDLETNLQYLDRSRRLRQAMLQGEKVTARQIPDSSR
ncbi:MAG TPA: carbon-nitrogen hydrolase family protein [Firmicutes bacterium]|jgi:predicted amidohydrolase|nr:carbon-nitrogen hydrolase family protein [Bacillota bacterium]